MFLLLAISLVQCASAPFPSLFHVYFPHIELTTTVYVDEVASAPLILIEVANNDGTIFADANASSVCFVVHVEFAKVSRNCVILKIIRSVRSH